MKKLLKKLLKPIVPNSIKKKWNAKSNLQVLGFEDGHYYSTIPSMSDIDNRSAEIFSKKDELPSVDLNMKEQTELLNNFASLHTELPLSLQKMKRFNVENDSFSYDDAPILHYMLRKIKPKRIIEVGSGNSSAVMLDTNELFLNNEISEFTFIDIDLARLRLQLKETDHQKITMIEKPIQTVDLKIFSELQSNDLLFIDSSHVSKIGSDLNTVLFKILPILKPGVYIHFHDIRFPFEYPKELIYRHVFWNEAYLLRAFLMNNNSYKISFWLNCLLNNESISKEQFSFLPLSDWDKRFNKNKGDFSNAGGSIYLRKLN